MMCPGYMFYHMCQCLHHSSAGPRCSETWSFLAGHSSSLLSSCGMQCLCCTRSLFPIDSLRSQCLTASQPPLGSPVSPCPLKPVLVRL